MDIDPIVIGLAGQGILNRQERERKAVGDHQAYMAQVTAYMQQGYSIEEAHSLVQDFYDRQATLQAQIPGPSVGQQIAQWDIFTWIGAIAVGGLALLAVMALLMAPFT